MRKEIYEAIENRLEKLMNETINNRPFNAEKFAVLDRMDTVFYTKLWNLEKEG